MTTTSARRVSAVWWGLVAAALLGTGCELVTTPDRSQIPGSGGTGGGGGAGGTGGVTSTGECAVAEDCPDPGNECQVRACVDQACTPAPVASGTLVAAQTAGDCKVVVCDGAGATTTNADDADVHVDGNVCTDDVCAAGVASNPPAAAGTACGAGGALYCDDAGACVGCLTDDQCGAPGDCATPTCQMGACDSGFAAPGTPVPAQTDGDCLEVQCDGIGGTKIVAQNSDVTDDGNPCTFDVCAAGAPTHPNAPSGAACAAGGIKCNGAGACVECLTGADCASLVCTTQLCIAATCMDGVKNGAETGTDCGGADCGLCAAGQGCAVAGDCASAVCTGNVCQAPTCADTVKNGAETDVDCGGGACAKCGPNLACTGNTDCKGGLCTGNTCVPTCTDAVKNGTESDVDCGGTCALKCASGKACGGNGDCASAVCAGSVCQAPACNDSTKNGTESDVDCGGTCATKCADLKQCAVGADCQSGKCTGNVCQAPTCSDVVKNAAETDVDCGGGTCPTCADGKVCSVDGDCVGGACVGGFCGASTCVDVLKNGQETDVDCGGPTCPACVVGQTCLVAGDCASGFCTAGTCVAPPNDNEPANNTCSGALPGPSLPATLNSLQLPTQADVDWFLFAATAADVGKVVHVQTTSSGVPPCDTVVEVFAGASCAALSSLGGPSDDLDYSENWLSTPIAAAGPIWVKVSYSSFGFSSAPYTLLVSTQ